MLIIKKFLCSLVTINKLSLWCENLVVMKKIFIKGKEYYYEFLSEPVNQRTEVSNRYLRWS